MDEATGLRTHTGLERLTGEHLHPSYSEASKIILGPNAVRLN